jgi:hypothetical protein
LCIPRIFGNSCSTLRRPFIPTLGEGVRDLLRIILLLLLLLLLFVDAAEKQANVLYCLKCLNCLLFGLTEVPRKSLPTAEKRTRTERVEECGRPPSRPPPFFFSNCGTRKRQKPLNLWSSLAKCS